MILMPSRLMAFWAALTGSKGGAPKQVRVTLALVGICLLLATGVIFVLKALEAELDDTLMVWTGMFIVLGLVMIWTAGRATHPDDEE